MTQPSDDRLGRVPVAADVVDASSDPPVGEAGQGMVEYALVLMLVAIVIIVIVTILGHQVSNVFSNVSHTFH